MLLLLKYSTYRNITAQWFRAAEENGDFIGIRYGRVAEGTCDVEWIYVSHCECDGIGGFTKILRERGEGMGELPAVRKSCVDVIAPLWRLWRSDWKKDDCSLRVDWGGASISSDGGEGDVAYHLFNEEETDDILERCRAMKVTVNSFLLSHLDTSVRPEIERSELANLWTVPVNLRGDVRNAIDTDNHVSCVDVRAGFNDSVQELQNQILTRLENGEHRANYLLMKLGGFLSHSRKVRYFKKDRLKPNGSIGSFSNLGAWDAKKKMKTRDSWLFCPPVMTGQLIGAGCVTFQNRLGLSIQVHVGIEDSKAKAKRCMDRWVNRVLLAPQSKNSTR